MSQTEETPHIKQEVDCERQKVKRETNEDEEGIFVHPVRRQENRTRCTSCPVQDNIVLLLNSDKCKQVSSSGECLQPQSLICADSAEVDVESRITGLPGILKVVTKERGGNCGNDAGIYSCPVCHISMTKFDVLTAHIEMVHTDTTCELHQLCNLQDVFPEDVGNDGKTISVEGFVLLAEAARENNSRLKPNMTDISSDYQGSSEVADNICDNLNGCKVTFPNEDCSTYSGHLDINDRCVLLDRTRKKLYKCEFCDMGFNFKCMLVQHRRTHTGEKPYKCDVCSVGFTHKCHLQDHKRIHTGERPYKCDVCGAGFTQKGHITGHKRVHTGEKPYRCDLCGAGFTQKCNLYQHIKTHTGEKPYQCDVCGVRFSQKGNLQEHFKTHTGERSYKCEHCGQKFSRKDRLEEHKTVRTRRKPFKCGVCGVGFACRGLVLEHKVEHTNEGLHK